MKEEKQYLTKKRKKIFITNIKIKNNSKDKEKQSLKNISKFVFEYIKEKGKTTLNEITNHINYILGIDNSSESIQKNIQRRIYDSINIMNAIGQIKKQKHEIEYVNNNKNFNENNQMNIIINEEKKNEKKINKKEDEYKEKVKTLEGLQKDLIENYLTLKFYQQFGNYSGKKRTKDDSSIYAKNSKLKLTESSSYDIIKRIMAPEILSKLNNNENNKSPIFYEKPKNNNIILVNEKILLENNKNKNNKEIKNLSKKKLTKIHIKDNKEKDEKEDEVFNYLKNIPLFKKELTFNNEKKKLE